MSFSVGIVGLPNVGKSTLFKALTKQKVDISNYPFCTIDPNVGIVEVPDERLRQVANVVKPQKITPAIIEFVDIAGLVKEAHKGEGLGNQFLSHIREVKIICQIVRAFDDINISHVEGSPDPKRDIAIINTELMMKDLETVSKRLEKAKKEAIKEIALLEKIKNILNQGQSLENQLTLEQKHLIKELNLLTLKPVIYIFNIKEKADLDPELEKLPHLILDLKIEEEMSDLTDQEQKELQLSPSQLNNLIRLCYSALDLITFYTIAGNKENRAWALKKGFKAPQAGAVIHADFEHKFIRCEAINWQKLIEAGSWHTAREKGWLRIEGKEYIILDGDVIEFKI